MTTVIFVVDQRQRAAIIEEVERRGEAISSHLAALSQGPLLHYNFTALEQNVAQMATEPDVLYAIVFDADGRVAAHSRRPDRVGHPLEDPLQARVLASSGPLTQETVLPGGDHALYDFAVPIVVESQRWGTIRGRSLQAADGSRDQPHAHPSPRPHHRHARARRRRGGRRRASHRAARAPAGRGCLRHLARRAQPAHRAVGLRRDQELAVAFNDMAAQLFQQRSALEDANYELRRRFDELEDVKRYTENILASLTNGIVTVDLDGRVVTLNPAAEKLTGFFAGEVTGAYCTELFAQTSEIGEMLMETLANHVPVSGVNLTLKRRSGVELPVEVSTAPLKGAEGKDLGVVAVIRDLTIVRELEGQLRRSDRLAALGSLAAGLAHEIKNPLTSVLTFSRHVARRFDDPNFRERFQRVVPRELERINRILERLLELARPVPATFTRDSRRPARRSRGRPLCQRDREPARPGGP
jgi:PAS domain S-box-containing protein